MMKQQKMKQQNKTKESKIKIKQDKTTQSKQTKNIECPYKENKWGSTKQNISPYWFSLYEHSSQYFTLCSAGETEAI